MKFVIATTAVSLLALATGCAGSASPTAAGPSASATVGGVGASTPTALDTPTASDTPSPPSADSNAGTPALIAGADFSSPETAGYTVMKALGAVSITRKNLLPYLDTKSDGPSDLASSLNDLDASIQQYKVKSITASHVVVADPHLSVRTSTYAEVEYSYSGTWCYVDGHCTSGDSKPYLKFNLAGGEWKMIINDVAYLLEKPS